MSRKISDCPCPEHTFVPIKGVKLEGFEVALDTESLPG